MCTMFGSLAALLLSVQQLEMRMMVQLVAVV